MKDLRDAGGSDLRDDSAGPRFHRARPAFSLPSESKGGPKADSPARCASARDESELRPNRDSLTPPSRVEGAEHPNPDRDGQNHADTGVFSAEGRQNFVRFVGRGGPLLGISLINLLLTVVTLGVYAFWGKTRERQYLWSRTLVLGEPLEYTGTGWQLFRSFLLVAGLFLGLNLGLAGLGLLDGAFWVAVSVVFSLFGVLVWPYALYCAMRFRLSRTRWRGVHGRMDGNPLVFAAQTWWRGLLTTLTAGLFFPYMVAFLTRYTLQSAFFGAGRFGFEGSARQLAQRYFGCWIMGAMATVMIVFGYVNEAVLMILGIIWLALAWVIWRVQRLNWTIDGVRFGQAAFEGRLTVPGYAWLKLSNGALIILTLGVFSPWARVRTWRYMTERMRMRGSVSVADLGQDNAALVKNGEGMFGFFDVDPGF